MEVKNGKKVVQPPLEAEALALCDGLEMGVFVRKLWEELTGKRDISLKGYSDSKSSR